MVGVGLVEVGICHQQGQLCDEPRGMGRGASIGRNRAEALSEGYALTDETNDMDKDVAVTIAQSTMCNFLRTGWTEHGLKHRYREGRWDVYSVDIAQWHILISDNGGRVVSALDCSKV